MGETKRRKPAEFVIEGPPAMGEPAIKPRWPTVSDNGAGASDERRSGKISIEWSKHGVGRLKIGRERWASVEWSELRQQWCIEDNSGRCLTHAGSLRGEAASKDDAVALAEAMIRDGRMPTPQEARASYAERVAADKQIRHDALRQMMDAEFAQEEHASDLRNAGRGL